MVKIQEDEKGILLGPGPCPLLISDWMDYLTYQLNKHENRLFHFHTLEDSSYIASLAFGSLMAAILIPQALSNQESLSFSIIIIMLFVTVTAIGVNRFFSKVDKYHAGCRDVIQEIIDAIISGTLDDPNLIREYYYQKLDEIGIKGLALIKELKLDKK